MALPDYSKYYDSYSSGGNKVKPVYQTYRQDVGRNQAIPRQRFAKGMRGYQPPAPDNTGGYQPTVYNPQATQPAPSDYVNHPFYDPATNYQTNPTHQQAFQPGTAAHNIYSSSGEGMEGYYYDLLNQQGLGGTDSRSQAAQHMLQDYQRGYSAAKLKNADLWFPQYMNGQNPNAFLDQMSNEAIGIDDTRFQGRDRWGMRGY